jgi:hypothetical protein
MLMPMLKVIGDFPTSQVKIYEFSGHSLFTNALLLHHDVTCIMHHKKVNKRAEVQVHSHDTVP